MFDQNGDGVITTEEMVTAMRGLGHNPTRKEVSEMLGLNPAEGTYLSGKDSFIMEKNPIESQGLRMFYINSTL